MHPYRKVVQSAAGLAVVLALVAGGPRAAWREACAKGSLSAPFTLRAIPSSSVHRSWQAPRIRNRNGTSTNWSGYAVYDIASSSGRKRTTSAATFSDVWGSWVVPEVIASESGSTYSAAWVGLDGYSSNTVEQIGTEQDWSNGSPQYYAWFEMYPKEGLRDRRLPGEPRGPSLRRSGVHVEGLVHPDDH